MVIDHVRGIRLSPEQVRQFGNELSTLGYLGVGLEHLCGFVRKIEARVSSGLPTGATCFSFGNDPALAWVPRDVIACCFHWYAVSACNYVFLVAWLWGKACVSALRPREYAQEVIPVVLAYRNKVAAHFAKVFPRNDDTEAGLEASIIYPIAFEADAFYAGSLSVTKSVRGETSTSPNMRWSLTKTHQGLRARYWPAPK